jgi:hypothetical protein
MISMGYFVKCPQCNETNSGGSLYCIKCQTSLIGIPREQDSSSTDEIKHKIIANKTTTKTTGRDGYAHIKIGVIVGMISFFVSSFFTFGGGFCCGLFISIGAGSISGLLTTRYANIGTRENASRFGTVAGGIAGSFVLLGQTLGGFLPSLIIGMFSALGVVSNNDLNLFADFFSTTFMSGLLNGILGLIAATIAGSIAAAKSFD